MTTTTKHSTIIQNNKIFNDLFHSLLIKGRKAMKQMVKQKLILMVMVVHQMVNMIQNVPVQVEVMVMEVVVELLVVKMKKLDKQIKVEQLRVLVATKQQQLMMHQRILNNDYSMNLLHVMDMKNFQKV